MVDPGRGAVLARAIVDAFMAAPIAAGVAGLVGFLTGVRAFPLGVGVLSGWAAAGATLAFELGRGTRRPDEENDHRELMWRVAGASVVAGAGLLNGLYAETVVHAGSIEGGLRAAHEASRSFNRATFGFLVVYVAPFCFAAESRRRGWPLAQRLRKPATIAAGMVGASWLFLAPAAAAGRGSLTWTGLVGASLGVLSWTLGPPLVHALTEVGGRVLSAEHDMT